MRAKKINIRKEMRATKMAGQLDRVGFWNYMIASANSYEGNYTGTKIAMIRELLTNCYFML